MLLCIEHALVSNCMAEEFERDDIFSRDENSKLRRVVAYIERVLGCRQSSCCEEQIAIATTNRINSVGVCVCSLISPLPCARR